MTLIRAVFFDLGKTLLYPKSAWQPVFLRANKALTKALIEQNINVDAHSFPAEFAKRLNQYYADRETSLREFGMMRLLQQILVKKGFADAPFSNMRIALNAFYAATQENWLLEADAYATLDALKEKGYKLAILSNAADDWDVHALLAQHNLRPYFDFIRSSEKVGYRKPHPKIFEEALNEFCLSPKESVMVGDTLDADIKGANKLGIYSVWINRHANKGTKTLKDIHPKAVIQELNELPKLLVEIR